MGHRLFHSLLTEARLALVEEDWLDVLRRLNEFAARVERHMRAEEDVLFPQLALLKPEASAALSQCRREHAEINVRIRAALDRAGEHDKAQCAQTLSQLIDFLSSHCWAEERCVYSLTNGMDESVVMSLARELSGLAQDPD